MVSSWFSLMSAAIYSTVSQHVAKCEANSANRVNPQKESVERDEEKGEGTSGTPSQSTPLVGVTSSRIQQLEHAGTENVLSPVQQVASQSVQPVEVNADGSQDVSVPSMSCPSIRRPTEVDASVVVFFATRSGDDVVHPDQVPDLTKLAKTNIGEEVLELSSNKDRFVGEYDTCTEAGEPALSGKKSRKVNHISKTEKVPDVHKSPSTNTREVDVVSTKNVRACIYLGASSQGGDSLLSVQQRNQEEVIADPTLTSVRIGEDIAVSFSPTLPCASDCQVRDSVVASVSGENALNSLHPVTSDVVHGDVEMSPPPNPPVAPSKTASDSPVFMVKDSVCVGIEAAMSYGDDALTGIKFKEPCTSDSRGDLSETIEISGPSTIDKKKRKKRNLKKPCASDQLFNLVLEDSVKEFYKKYMSNKLIKKKEIANKTIFIDIDGHLVYYEDFYQSLKPRGWVSNEVMTAFVQIFSQQFAKKVVDQKSRMKLAFSPYFTDKLNVTPAKFDVKSVSRELRAINKKYNLAKCDLVTNFHKACIETNILAHDMDSFEHVSPDDLPQQDNGNDCGLYVLMYMENLDGQEFKIFASQVMPQYRMLVSHRLSSAS